MDENFSLELAAMNIIMFFFLIYGLNFHNFIYICVSNFILIPTNRFWNEIIE